GNPSVAAPTGSSAGGPPSDGIWPDLLAVIKHINYHLTPGGSGYDGKVNMANLTSVSKTVLKLPDLATKEHYGHIVHELTGKSLGEVANATAESIGAWVVAKGPTGTVYGAYAPPAPKPTAKLVQGLTAQRVIPWRMNATAEQGVLKTTAGKETLTGQTAFEMDLGNGMTGIYIPQGDANNWSKMGRVQIIRRNYTGSITDLDETTAQLERLGIEVKLATAQDLELLYLQKAAHSARVEELASYKTGVLDKIASNPDMDPEGQIAFHKAFWEKRLGKKLSTLPAYDPTPKFDRNWVPANGVTNETAGWAWWNRFDLTPDSLQAEMPGYKLIHHITNGDSVLDNVKRIVENNGAFSPTEEQIRLGLHVSGMSSGADQDSGGANYFFTRINGPSGRGDYEFKADLLLRTDNVSYNGDTFGNTHASNLTQRGVTVANWKSYAEQSRNETIIKNGVSFFDYLERINARSVTERVQILDYLKSKGITQLGGKPVDQVVIAR
ncbi:MAG: hypothetical protein Q8R28_03820, partial [Dehalococcoidia bacterium]|nr:hypothetical protein [Dehalococcoidia bacterium]